MSLIIGIDPGLLNTGWGIIQVIDNRLIFVSSGTITTNVTDLVQNRLLHIHNNLSEVITKFSPNQAAIEETFVNKNSSTSLKLGQARGAIILTVGLSEIPIHEYSATKIKKSIVGTGRADKLQIKSMVKILLPKSVFNSEHAADALAVAICHVNHMMFFKNLKYS